MKVRSTCGLWRGCGSQLEGAGREGVQAGGSRGPGLAYGEVQGVSVRLKRERSVRRWGERGTSRVGGLGRSPVWLGHVGSDRVEDRGAYGEF